jgi:hypothetical protein
MRPDDRLFHDESLSKGYAGESAELCVAALDQLLKGRTGQACFDRGAAGWLEL